MRRVLASTFVLAAFFASTPAPAVSTQMLISEFRTRGPNGANDEFIEIFNASATTVNISGWSVMASDGSGNTVVLKQIPAATTVQGLHFYLLTNNGSQGYSGTTAPNATYSIGVPDDGGIALVNASSTVIDQVGMSAGSAYKEGTPLAPLVSNVNQSYERNNGGCAATHDSDDNAVDFRFNQLSSGPQNATFNCSSCVGVVCSSPPTVCYSTSGTCSAGTCSYSPLATGASCSDGDACTVNDACNASHACVSGAAETCTTPPPNFCSGPRTLTTYAPIGTCSSLAGCTYTPSPQNCPFGCNGTTKQCNPDPCTSVSCNAPSNDCYQPSGTCVNGNCVYQPKAATTPCSDGNGCTSGDACDGSGKCVGGAAKPVDDSNPCTTDACDTTTGVVSHTAVTDGTNCDDGNPCNGVATCKTGTCTNGAATTCTTPPIGGCYSATGTCNPANGACTYQPLAPGSSCSDGNLCTKADACDGNGACGGSAVTCTPGTPTCTDVATSRTFQPGSCQTADGSCSVASTDKHCDFGCDSASGLCKADPCIGVVCNTPPAAQCYQTTGTCSNGTCSYATTEGAGCNDGDPCTGSDNCSAAGACAGTPLACNTPPLPTCKDAQTSTHPDVTGTCTAGTCAYTTSDFPCTAGCDSTTGLCNDDPCKSVNCDEPPDQCHQALGTCAGGKCTYELKQAGATCDDSDPCTVSDVCTAAGACAGDAKTCNTPPAPTCDGTTSHGFDAAGACDNGTCSYTAKDDTCSSGCDSATGLCKEDPCRGVSCGSPPGACYLSTGTCSDGKCTYAPRSSQSSCDDQNACTGSDHCDGNGACVGSPIASCGADAGSSGGRTSAGGAAGSGNQGGSSGTTTGTGGSGTGAGGATSADAGMPGPGSGASTTIAGGGTSSGSCGCSVPGSTRTTAWPLGLLAVTVLAIRRRRR